MNLAVPALKHILSWTLLILGLIIMASWWANTCLSKDETFQPMRVVQPRIYTDPVYRGEPVRLINGVCNETKQAIRVEIWLALRPEGTSLIGRSIIDLLGTQTVGAPEDIEPGRCIGESVVETAPLSLPLGYWSLIGQVITRGANPSEVQRVPLSSNVFEVRDER